MADDKEPVKYYTDNSAPVVDTDIADFFIQTEIDANRFNQQFPYQLLILKVDQAYGPVQAGQSNDSLIAYVPLYKYTLPVPPQDLNINMQIPTVVHSTLEGIVEQHGGAPFRDIILSGTTGVTPIKNDVSGTDPSTGILTIGQTLFGGTTRAVASAIADGRGIVRTSILNSGISSIKSPQNSISDSLIPGTSTGYYQFRLLQKFIESYVELKKKNRDWNGVNTKDLRLAFAIHKDESVYLCSGVQFNYKRNISSPLEYTYVLQLKAWKRVNLSSQGKLDVPYVPVTRSTNGMLEVTTRLNAVTDMLDSIGSIPSAILNDGLYKAYEANRIAVNWSKSISSSASYVLSDFPGTIQRSLLKAIENNWADVKNNYAVLQQYSQNGFTENFFHGAEAIPRAPLPSEIKKIDVSSIKGIPLSVRNLMNKEIQATQSLHRSDFEKQKEDLKQVLLDFTDRVGAGGVITNETYNRNENITAAIPTDEEFTFMYALNELITALDKLAVSRTVNPIKLTSLEYIAGLAERSGIAFKQPISKFAVPYPYNHTLEQVAKLYLGDANRWIEIAALNGLRSPYVDEEGFSYSFLTNGDGNKLYISSDANLFVGQVVWLSCLTQPRSRRRITGIRKQYDNFFEITVDGESNLQLYLVGAQARISAFLPGTVNSQQVIYIPSDKQTDIDPELMSIPGVDQFDPMLEVGGVDLLLTSSGDLAITPEGDCKLAVGLQNIIQTVKIALTTPQGTLIHHPQYGIPLELGMSTSDVSAKDIVKAIVSMFEGDPTFTGVSSVQVNKAGPVVSVVVVIGVKGISDTIPIEINIVR